MALTIGEKMNTLPVRLASRSVEGREMWTITAYLPGARPTTVIRRSDNSTTFGTRSAATTAANNFARSLGFAGIEQNAEIKKAAKRSV